MNPLEAAVQVINAAQYLQDATAAAHICDGICTDIRETLEHRLPVTCELLRLGQLFPEREGVRDLNRALLQCVNSVYDALHDAVAALYEHLQRSKVNRLRHAASVKGLLEEKRTRLTNRFNDVSAYMQLATLLRSMQSTEQAQHTDSVVQELRAKVLELKRVHTADKEVVRARAKAALAQHVLEEKEFRVISPGLTRLGVCGVMAMSLSPCGHRFAAVGRGASAAVWDAATGDCMHELSGHSDIVCAVAWSPDGARVATASFDSANIAVVWDAATGTRMHELRGHDGWVGSIAWSPDGSRVATGSGDHTAAVWDVETGRRMHELRGHAVRIFGLDGVNCVAWSPDASELATAADDGTAAVWDAGTGDRVRELRGHSNVVQMVAWSPAGTMLATASWDHTAVVWDADAGTRMQELRGHNDLVTSIAWSPGGCRVATGSDDKTAALWDVGAGCRMHELRGHSGVVTAVTWSPDGSRVATSAGDGHAFIWDATTGDCMHVLRKHRKSVRAVVWGQGGRSLWTASHDGTVRVYNVEPPRA